MSNPDPAAIQLELIPGPHERCKKEWRCPVCGATPKMLKPLKRGGPRHVYCGSCGIGFDLSLRAIGKKTRYVPKCHEDAEWRRVWKRAWIHFGTARATRKWMGGFGTAEDANNAMNRLDGGIIPDGR